VATAQQAVADVKLIVAFIVDAAPIERILTSIGETAYSPAIAPPADHPPGMMTAS
jgi:hypothetical protein